MTTTVFVSGANGYIALHLIKLLIAEGYHVVGSVRTEEKAQLLKSRFPENFEVEVVASLLDQKQIEDALSKHPEVTVFLHTASPVIFNAKDRVQEVVVPAIQGTVGALKAASSQGNIKHFVYTSSVAALHNLPQVDRGEKVTEDTWSEVTYEEADTSDNAAYTVSKKYAELAAWDYVKENKPGFTFTCVNPVLVVGPQAFEEDVNGPLNASALAIRHFLTLKPEDEIPQRSGSFVDVRDVARAHIVAFTNPDLDGKKLLTSTEGYTGVEVVNIIREKFPDLNLPVRENPPKPSRVDNSATRKYLGSDFISLEQSIQETVAQFLGK